MPEGPDNKSWPILISTQDMARREILQGYLVYLVVINIIKIECLHEILSHFMSFLSANIQNVNKLWYLFWQTFVPGCLQYLKYIF